MKSYIVLSFLCCAFAVLSSSEVLPTPSPPLLKTPALPSFRAPKPPPKPPSSTNRIPKPPPKKSTQPEPQPKPQPQPESPATHTSPPSSTAFPTPRYPLILLTSPPSLKFLTPRSPPLTSSPAIPTPRPHLMSTSSPTIPTPRPPPASTSTPAIPTPRPPPSTELAVGTTTEFKCQMAGRFPDPYDCRYFYDCNSGGTYTWERCGPRERYSVVMQTCALDSNVVCYNPAFKCTTAGDKGAWSTDPRIFYVCEVSGTSGKLIPLLFKCPEGSIFSGNVCL
uniref:Chitin-binding type-2 domain-containing protein n=1 Tax=Zeugodacus cucurbitae TaxID=28588 RepID=A0A0A1X9F4_ZEUCU